MNDYDRVARIIRYLDEHQAEQPSLARLAGVAGLSESHLHRLFHRWAGITPKDFLQCLTLERVKDQLCASRSVLEASLHAGLSGPGRTHDLCISLEAATPGELKSRGEGMEINYGAAETPFGWSCIAWTRRGVCHLVFHPSQEAALSDPVPKTAWSHAQLKRDDKRAKVLAAEIFQHQRSSTHPLRAYVRGTAFQVRVWRALVRVPEGTLATYQEIARSLGDPRLARAVGTACGSNTIGFLIPCHRVIRETGVVQGFRWGTDRKKAMLAWESTTRPTPSRPVNTPPPSPMLL